MRVQGWLAFGSQCGALRAQYGSASGLAVWRPLGAGWLASGSQYGSAFGLARWLAAGSQGGSALGLAGTACGVRGSRFGRSSGKQAFARRPTAWLLRAAGEPPCEPQASPPASVSEPRCERQRATLRAPASHTASAASHTAPAGRHTARPQAAPHCEAAGRATLRAPASHTASAASHTARPQAAPHCEPQASQGLPQEAA